MPEYTNRITDLIIKKLKGELNDVEAIDLQTWIDLSENNRAIADEFLHEEKLKQGIRDMYTLDERIWRRLEKSLNTSAVASPPAVTASFKDDRKMPAQNIFSLRRRIAAAAVIILMLSAGGYFYFNNKGQKQITANTPQINNDVAAPAANKAMITLANGERVFLDSAGNGTLATQGIGKRVKS